MINAPRAKLVSHCLPDVVDAVGDCWIRSARQGFQVDDAAVAPLGWILDTIDNAVPDDLTDVIYAVGTGIRGA